jgi:hypothetical protein
MSRYICSHVAFIFQKMIQSEASPAHPTKRVLPLNLMHLTSTVLVGQLATRCSWTSFASLHCFLSLPAVNFLCCDESSTNWFTGITSYPCTVLTLTYNTVFSTFVSPQLVECLLHSRYFIRKWGGGLLGDYSLDTFARMILMCRIKNNEGK